MNRLLVIILSVAPFVAAGTSPPTSVDPDGLRHFSFHGGFFIVGAPSQWDVKRASNDDSFPIAEFQYERSAVLFRGYPIKRSAQANEEYQKDLDAALERTPKPDRRSWDTYHTWQVFRSHTTEANVPMEVRDYYSIFSNPHSHTYGVHVTLRYPADIDAAARKRLNDGLIKLFTNVFIEDKR